MWAWQRSLLTGDTLAARALSADQVQRLADGESLSLRIPREDGTLLVEARPTPAGGIVLAQRRGDAVALAGQALQELTIALIITGVVAIALALLVAWRLSRPLRRTAVLRVRTIDERVLSFAELRPATAELIARQVRAG